MKLVFLLTIALEKLLMSQGLPSNMDNALSNMKKAKDSTKDGDGLKLEMDTYYRVS